VVVKNKKIIHVSYRLEGGKSVTDIGYYSQNAYFEKLGISLPMTPVGEIFGEYTNGIPRMTMLQAMDTLLRLGRIALYICLVPSWQDQIASVHPFFMFECHCSPKTK
jgi:hypothetical protein